jgi:hypothetical protein
VTGVQTITARSRTWAGRAFAGGAGVPRRHSSTWRFDMMSAVTFEEAEQVVG